MPVALRRRQGTEKERVEPPSKSRKIDPPEPIEGKNTRRSRQQSNLAEKCTTAANPWKKRISISQKLLDSKPTMRKNVRKGKVLRKKVYSPLNRELLDNQ